MFRRLKFYPHMIACEYMDAMNESIEFVEKDIEYGIKIVTCFTTLMGDINFVIFMSFLSYIDFVKHEYVSVFFLYCNLTTVQLTYVRLITRRID